MFWFQFTTPVHNLPYLPTFLTVFSLLSIVSVEWKCSVMLFIVICNYAPPFVLHQCFGMFVYCTVYTMYQCLSCILAQKCPLGWINLILSLHPGSDVVEWLFHHIEGFQDRREARKYASNLLKAGFIRHTVNKITFSEQCYYVFGDLSDCENCK